MVCKKIEKGQEKGEGLAISKYELRRKSFTLVMEELKRRITAKATKVKRYDNRIKLFQGNRNFQNNQGIFFKHLEDKEEGIKLPNLENARAFWKGIWSTKIKKSSISGIHMNKLEK